MHADQPVPTMAELRAGFPPSAGANDLPVADFVAKLGLLRPEQTPRPEKFRIPPHHQWVVPDYQRAATRWTRGQQARFVGFLLAGGKPPPFWVQTWPSIRDERLPELVDGLQRATALRDFLVGDVHAEMSGGRAFYLRQMAQKDQDVLWMGAIPFMVHVELVRYPTRAAVIDFYLGLNNGGSVHTRDELSHAERLRDAARLSGE